MSVLIVGAGPTGLVTAALLANHGVPSVVVERFTEIYPLPRAVHLDDEVMRILQAVGIGKEFLPLTRPALGLRLLDARHRTIAEFARARAIGDHGYPQANMFDQPDLERILRKHVRSLPLVELRLGCALEDLRPGQALVGNDWIAADYVLACDGANSSVRSLIGSVWTDLHFTERWLVIDVVATTDLHTWDGIHQVCDPDRAATFMQVGEGRYRWEFQLRTGETPDSMRPQLGALLQPWTRRSDLEGLTVIRCVEYTFCARLAERWRSGRVFLLGDAAHQTPPFIGQGLAAGLRDAMNLTWKLALVMQQAAPESLLESYEAERKPHARSMIRLALVVGWILTGGQGPAARPRHLLLSALCRLPGVSPRVLDRGTPGFVDGPLVSRRWFGGPQGRLIPQPRIDGALLDSALGQGFSVLKRRSLSGETQKLASLLNATVIEAGGDMRSWLSSHRADAVVVRPDRVVLAVQNRRGKLSGASWPAALPAPARAADEGGT